jgi:aspartate ammonia-lyase
MGHRIEKDFLGEREIPDDIYYGVQTLRGIENFHITGIPISNEPYFIQAFGYVKKAAALANRDLGKLSAEKATAIAAACDRLIAGEFRSQFPTDMIQGGAGTSTNMNVNEVIANVALEGLGFPKGDYHRINPNDDVNCSQSTNDAYPTAFRIALIQRLGSYSRSLALLSQACRVKGDELAEVLKMGRTHLQDAVPMSMGQEFRGFATTLDEELRASRTPGTAGRGQHGRHGHRDLDQRAGGLSELVVSHLRRLTGIDLKLAVDLVEATSDTGAYVQLSGVLKRTAVKLSKICNDLRLLSSGPRTGFNEINLPQLQPGSSIMPGKVNPVIPEVVNQAAFFVIGADLTVTLAASAGQLQLNVMEPVISYSLFSSIYTMENAVNALREKCIVGITANAQRTHEMVLNSLGIITLISPILGYKQCSEIARGVNRTSRSIRSWW